MLETLLAIVFSWWAIVGLGVMTIVLCHVDAEGWSLFFLVVLGVVLYRVVNPDPTTFFICVAAYIPVGIAWSFYRWKRHCDRKMEDVVIDSLSNYGRESLIEKITPKENITKIVHWIFVWPFSFIDEIFSDIIDFIITLVKKHLIEIYNRISTKHLDQLNAGKD